VKFLRQKHGIRAAPPPDRDSDLFTIEQTAHELGVTHTTIYPWLRPRSVGSGDWGRSRVG